MSEAFREVTVATGWIAGVLQREISRRGRDVALAAASVHHVGQGEIRIRLPGGTVIVIDVHIDDGPRP
ncbi:hypothetical protein [Pseudactinotalea sp. HY158]|uniref:hypothetical protein n=1 Tax=Pseudactinotalea sp. HY158 TaxID=2654547 RepID=UPI00129C323F|nr:hypothetical protein [Pseudactinotalea sp. HY158]QGH70583.1 hypothetical protein GCE65_14605 [Pseudactinotalea sp. HY158]